MPVKASTLTTAIIALAFPLFSHAFSFSEDEEKERSEEFRAAEQYRQQAFISESCKKKLKNRKVAFIIGESHVGGRVRPISYKNYGSHFQIINRELRRNGMRTYTQQEITNQIAQAEIAAALNNDPDAALAAASRLGASFILRGVISSRTNFNPIAKTNEVYVNMGFTLSNASGRIVADASAGADSWAGGDTLSVSLSLVQENAALIVGKLYNDYCS